MKGISKLAKIITKILEVFHWVGAGLMVVATVCSVIATEKIGYFVGLDIKECCGTNQVVYGFEVNASYVDGSIDMTTFLLFGIGAVIILILMAMVFRNVHLIFKKSENGTPFQKDNIRMLKEIGIFSITVPVIGLVMSVIIRLVIGVDAVEININQSGLFMGIIVLCLTQYFIYGAELEKDVDGLLQGDFMGKIVLRLDRMMVERKMSLNELAERVGISNVNLSKIKNNKVTAIRFSTLAAICEALDCDAGDILEYQKEDE